MNIQNLVLDINKKCNQLVTANVGEVNSRLLKINVIDNGVPIDLTGITVYLYAKKADGTKVFNTVKVEDAKQGIVLAEITSQILAMEGFVKLTLLLTKDKARLASKIFTLKVDETIVDDEAIESTNEFTALTDALGRVNNIDSRFENINSQLEQIANKGTTVDVLERVTKEELERQILDGTIANLTIEDDSITFEKLNKETIFDILEYKDLYYNFLNCVMDNSVRIYPFFIFDKESFEDINYTIPKGTIITGEVELLDKTKVIETTKPQLFQGEGIDSKFDTSLGFTQLKSELVMDYKYKYSSTVENDFNIQNNIKLSLDLTFGDVLYSDDIKFTNIEIKLPNGKGIKPINIEPSGFKCETFINKREIDISKNKDIININNKLDNINNELDSINNGLSSNHSRWNGKKYISVGDSLTWLHGNEVGGELKVGYQKYIVDKLGVELTNYGDSGRTMGKIEGWKSIMDSYKNVSWENYDLVTIMLGANDHGKGVPLGSIDSMDISTYMGAYNALLNHIYSVNSNIRIVLCTSMQYHNHFTPNDKNLKLIDYVNAVIEIGEKWACPVYDSFRLSGWNEYTYWNGFTYDGQHGTNLGYKRLGEPMANAIACLV